MNFLEKKDFFLC